MHRHRILAAILFALSLVGLVGTWTFNIAFLVDPPAGLGYLEGWFANAASTSASIDLLVVAIGAGIVMIVEGARLGWSRWAWAFVPLSLVTAVAFAFPLFLGLRELALERRARAAAVG